MRKLILLLLALFAFGCSGGGSTVTPTIPADENPGRVSFSQPYAEGDFNYVEVSVADIQSMYQFRVQLEFDPACVDFNGFEPSGEFGTSPRMRAEKVANLSESIRTRMNRPENGLADIEVSLPDAVQNDLASPDYLGRLKYKIICERGDNGAPFSFINDPGFLEFRKKNQERVRVNPNDECNPPRYRREHNGGNENPGEGCGEKCKKENCDCECGCKDGGKCTCENCDCKCKKGEGGGCGDKCKKCGKGDCGGNCGDKCDKCGKDGCGGNCGDKCDKCGKDGCDGGCGNGGDPDKCGKCGKEDCGGNCGDVCDKCGKEGCSGNCGGGGCDKEGCECPCHDGGQCNCDGCECPCHGEGGGGGDNGGGGNGGGGCGGGGGNGGGGCGGGGGGGCGGGGHRP